MKKYQPSNGTEGMMFCSKFCDRCIHQHPDPNHEKQCLILSATLCLSVSDPEYPVEWCYDENGNPQCTAWQKWDWGQDDDGNWVEPEPVQPDDPNQLCLPFIFDEIGVPKSEEEPSLLNTENK